MAVMERMINKALKERLAHNFPSMISHPPGWDDIVQRLHNRLMEIEPNYTVAQTKQKFGTLRFYASLPKGYEESTWKDVWEAIRIAEDESSKTCENCGNPGKLRSGSWIRTLCDRCEATRQGKK